MWVCGCVFVCVRGGMGGVDEEEEGRGYLVDREGQHLERHALELLPEPGDPLVVRLGRASERGDVNHQCHVAGQRRQRDGRAVNADQRVELEKRRGVGRRRRRPMACGGTAGRELGQEGRGEQQREGTCHCAGPKAFGGLGDRDLVSVAGGRRRGGARALAVYVSWY